MATYATYRHVELDNVGYGKKRVLKPPGGGSSDIFGSAPEDTSPRRVKNHNQSQLGLALFGDEPNGGARAGTTGSGGKDASGAGAGAAGHDPVVSPRSNRKPGNDSHNRLFGPPDAPPTTPNARNHMRSNIPVSEDETSPVKSGSTGALANGLDASNAGAHANDITGGSSCMPRNPVTGDGVDVTPLRRSARKCRDGNPVTGTGYTTEAQNGPAIQNGRSSSNSSIGDKSTDSSPAAGGKGQQPRTRVPPGGYSSGLW